MKSYLVSLSTSIFAENTNICQYNTSVKVFAAEAKVYENVKIQF